MGTGKSEIARELSRARGLSCVDLDGMIEKREGMAITDIFALRGEKFFRGLESAALKEVARGEQQVVSCGGGIVIDPANIEIMKRTGIVVCLTARPDIIQKRTAGYKNRPLLNVDDPLKKITELLAQRSDAYARADHTVDTSDMTVEQAAAAVWELVS